MAKFGDGPLGRAMARGALASEQADVAIFGTMATGTVERHFEGCHRRFVGSQREHRALAYPRQEFSRGLLRLAIRGRAVQQS